jgi:hypothetical protein
LAPSVLSVGSQTLVERILILLLIDTAAAVNVISFEVLRQLRYRSGLLGADSAVLIAV